MATIANPVGAFDFAHTHDFSSTTYDFDPLATLPNGWTTKSAIPDMDSSFFQHYFSPDVEGSGSSTPHSSSQPVHPTSGHSYSLAQAPSSASLSSDATSQTMQSTVPSSMSSPELAFHYGPLSDVSGAVDAGYLSTADPATFGAGFAEYPNLLPGEKQESGFVDPSLIHQQGMLTPPSINTPVNKYSQVPHPASPALSQASSQGISHNGSARLKSSRSQSPYPVAHHHWSPYPPRAPVQSRGHSEAGEIGESERERNRCPHPECGKIFKDLKAHMLTHQNERPEKCPIPSCEYSKKGFSRKYDKNRHTLTHYKGTMVCGFCPGSGSSAEKSFNRADVFKRHLTTVHGVEQNPPNSRKKPSSEAQKKSTQNFGDATGKCSICSRVFSNAQDFYEHLEDCVLNVVQNPHPSEAINEQLLTSVAEDKDVLESLERHNLPTSLDNASNTYEEGDDEAEEEVGDESEGKLPARPEVGPSHVDDRGAIAKPGAPSRGRAGGRGPGITFSKGGWQVPRSGRKRRKNYPNSWGCNADKMKMKKRVMAVFDGQRRLIKDDMMLSSEHEVRRKLPGADDGAYVTDLDLQSLQRAEGFFSATEEERGPWEQFVTNVPDGNMGGLVP